jgi:hypothetical protein
LRVIPGGERHDAGLALRGRELGEAVPRAAELEGAGVLQGFELQQHSASHPFVEWRAGEQGSSLGMAGEASCGRSNVLEAGQCGHVVNLRCRGPANHRNMGA